MTAIRGFLALAVLLVAVPAAALAPPPKAATRSAPWCGLMLAGLLVLEERQAAEWEPARAWQYPVGHPLELGSPGPDGEPPYRLNRGLVRDGSTTHLGADLCNRARGGTVRAAAHGLVVHTSDDESSGFGVHAVLAHRLEDSRLAYSVYAHLERGSLAVEPGALLERGAPIGLVGRTGRASTDHLHFEIRLADDPERRWEKAPAVDPLSFLAERLMGPTSDRLGPAPRGGIAPADSLVSTPADSLASAR